MRFQFSARDVNGTVLSPPSVSALFAEEGPGRHVNQVVRRIAPGQPLDAQLAVDRFVLQISANPFSVEEVTLATSEQRWQSDNPACAVTSQAGLVDVVLTVGCVRFAASTHIPPDAIVADNPRAALIEPATGDAMYRGAWLNRETLYRLDEPVFGDPDAKEWKRFNHSPLSVELKHYGTFVLLEYGYPVALGSRNPRFLLAAWAPLAPLAEAPHVVVFFSPPTFAARGYPPDKYPFLGPYPYELTPRDAKTRLPVAKQQQPYPDLAINYLVTGYKLLYQLVAAGRNPIVVMPIGPSAQWGPVAAQSGMARALNEVVRFLYAQRLVSSRAAPAARLSLSGGRTSVVAGRGFLTDERVPEKLAITIAGFSAGINPVVSLCGAPDPDPKQYPPAVFRSPPELFTRQWREIWDVDGVDSLGWDHLVKAFRGWLRSDRRLRSYHSMPGTYRGGPNNGLIDPAQVLRKPGKAGYVEEGTSSDGRVTWVGFSDSYLTGNKRDLDHKVTIPEFGSLDAHHMVPAIAFGHAAQFPLA